MVKIGSKNKETGEITFNTGMDGEPIDYGTREAAQREIHNFNCTGQMFSTAPVQPKFFDWIIEESV